MFCTNVLKLTDHMWKVGWNLEISDKFYAMCCGMEIFDNAKFFVSLWVFHWTAFRNDDIQASLLKMFVNKT